VADDGHHAGEVLEVEARHGGQLPVPPQVLKAGDRVHDNRGVGQAGGAPRDLASSTTVREAPQGSRRKGGAPRHLETHYPSDTSAVLKAENDWERRTSGRHAPTASLLSPDALAFPHFVYARVLLRPDLVRAFSLVEWTRVGPTSCPPRSSTLVRHTASVAGQEAPWISLTGGALSQPGMRSWGTG
jgi:hypothetical protein